MKALHYLIFLIFFVKISQATHNRSGEILYKRIAPFTNGSGPVYTFSITVVKYFDSGVTVADRCVDTVYFGDGSKGVAPRINGSAGCCPAIGSNTVGCGEIIFSGMGYVVKKSIFSVIHTYSSPGVYNISSRDPNRTSGSLSISNSGSEPFVLSSQISINTSYGENTGPQLPNPPIDQGLVTGCYEHCAAAFDPDGDSLSYELLPCPVASYTFPGSGSNPATVNNFGLIQFCNAPLQGEYNLVLLVKEWRRDQCGVYQLIGQVGRDLQMVILAGNPTAASLTAPSATCISGGTYTASVSGTYTGNVNVNLFGWPVEMQGATINPISGPGTISRTVSWNASCQGAFQRPHDFYTVSRLPGAQVNQRIYNHWTVKLNPPAPVMGATTIDTSQIVLNWSLVNCGNRGLSYKIYRKFGSDNWQSVPCSGGVPSSSGYVNIGTVSGTVSTYTDYDLWTIPNGSQGNYIVTTLMDDCTESVANSQSVTLIVGLNENSLQNSISIYPNPAADKFNLNTGNELTSVDVDIISANGQLIFQSRIKGNKEIETAGWANGIYLVKVKSGASQAIFKFVKIPG